MKKLGKLFRNLLIVCGVLFIIALLLPDEEEKPADQEQTGVETASGIGTQTGTETASGAETLAGAAENFFPEDMVKEKQTEIKGDGKDQATVFVYMNGSDLESEDGEATEDLCEMLAANISSQVNVLVETIGTKSWSKRLGIASDHTQRYKAEAGNLVLVDDSLGQLDCTSPDTLADFISWGAENYPANRYILIFWDHGAGPVYGFGYDEHQSEDSVLTIDEIQTAIRQSGIYFDIIGMDSCIMSSLELCCAMYNYCDYMIRTDDKNVWQGSATTPRVTNVEIYNKTTGTYEPLNPSATYALAGMNYTLRNLGDGFAMFDGATLIKDYVSEDYLVMSSYAAMFGGVDENGLPHLSSANSPLADYPGYLLNYEEPYGAGRIQIIW